MIKKSRVQKSLFTCLSIIFMLLASAAVTEPVAGGYNSTSSGADFSTAEINTGNETAEGDLIDYSQIPVLKWVGPGKPGTYEEYKHSQPQAPLKVTPLPNITQGKLIPPQAQPHLLFMVNSSLYASIEPQFSRYLTDAQSVGYEMEAYLYESGTAEEVKSYIEQHSQNLTGCIFIGSIPSAWFEVENDYNEYGYAEFPCDLFYMDLDGTWEDTDSNGRYDSHTAGDGDEGPEIFVARIDASTIPGDEPTLVNNYLERLHEYYNGTIRRTQYGLTYTEDDWVPYSYFKYDISYAYDNYDAIWAPDTSRDDYRDNRLANLTYEFIQLACHSSSSGHYFTRGGQLSSDDVKNVPPRALLYNLFACSACRFTDSNYLGGAYIFSDSDCALSVLGSTKTGSMLIFDKFYRPLGTGKCLGQAFKDWFDSLAPYSESETYWHYGMCILGDPLVTRTIRPLDDLVQVTTDPGSDYDPSITQTDDGKVWVVWQSYRSGGNGIWYKTSSDGGATWSDASQITTDPDYGYAPAIAQTDDGKIWVTFYSYESGNPDIWYR